VLAIGHVGLVEQIPIPGTRLMCGRNPPLGSPESPVVLGYRITRAGILARDG